MPISYRGSGQHQGLWCWLERLWFWMTEGPHTIWAGPSWGPDAGMPAEPCTKPHGECWSWLGLPVPISRPPQGRSRPVSLPSSGPVLLVLASFHHPIRGPCANPLHRMSPQLHRMFHEEKQTWKDTAQGPSSTETWRMRRKTNPTEQSSRVESRESYTTFFFFREVKICIFSLYNEEIQTLKNWKREQRWMYYPSPTVPSHQPRKLHLESRLSCKCTSLALCS